jgi:hypothetical protein
MATFGGFALSVYVGLALLPFLLGVLFLLDRLFRAELRGGDGASDRARGRWRAASSLGAGETRPRAVTPESGIFPDVAVAGRAYSPPTSIEVLNVERG